MDRRTAVAKSEHKVVPITGDKWSMRLPQVARSALKGAHTCRLARRGLRLAEENGKPSLAGWTYPYYLRYPGGRLAEHM
jgi:hypothetical protein